MKSSWGWWWWWWWPPFQLPLFFLVSIFATLLLSRSESFKVPGDLGAVGPPALRALPHGEGSKGPSRLGEGSGRGIVPSILNDKHDTAVIALSDGTIYLVNSNSGKVYGSFSSGSPLMMSYQAFSERSTATNSDYKHSEVEDSAFSRDNNYFISCGDDWNLYEHTAEFGKRRIEMTVEDYVKSTPRISLDGGVTLGSKRSTVFLVDAKNGKVITSHWPDEIQQAEGIGSQGGELVLTKLLNRDWVELSPAAIPPVLITRTDYVLNHFMTSDKLLWGLTVSMVKAYSCQRVRDGLGPEHGGGGEQCNIWIPVHQINGLDPVKNGLVSIPKASSRKNPKLLALAAPPTGHNAGHDIVHSDLFSGSRQVEENPRTSLSLLDGSRMSSSLSVEQHEGNNSSLRTNVRQTVSEIKSQVVNIFVSWYLILLSLVMPIVYYVKVGIQGKSVRPASGLIERRLVVTRRRKARKIGKNNGPIAGTLADKELADEGLTIEKKNEDELMSYIRFGETGDGKWIGKLFLSKTEIAKGSNGTVILEGVYAGRPVAVKRLVQTHHEVAFKEIQNLIASDQHPNIIRWFGVEHDLDFIYLSLERCTCSLNDLIQSYSDSPVSPALTQGSENEYKVWLDLVNRLDKGVELWKPNGCPSSQLLKLMRDVVSGLAHLHELGIIHRDIKPQNVLISADRSLTAKISDMGISKHLPDNMSSLGHHSTASGSSGWQAPEQLLNGRQTRAVDLFSLGCVLFFCITKGRHPFGSHFERDSNIVKNNVDLFLVEHNPEAVHLFSLLLSPHPEKRPKAVEVLHHPFFWSCEERLSFLRDASDRVELEDREKESELLEALESSQVAAFGGKWGDKLDAPLIADMGRYRRYRFDCVRDLLRVIRNKLNHYRELPRDLQELLGSVPEGFDYYFKARFPSLLIEVYKVMHRHCQDDPSFQKYFTSSGIS